MEQRYHLRTGIITTGPNLAVARGPNDSANNQPWTSPFGQYLAGQTTIVHSNINQKKSVNIVNHGCGKGKISKY
jgi:hypothetical protein